MINQKKSDKKDKVKCSACGCKSTAETASMKIDSHRPLMIIEVDRQPKKKQTTLRNKQALDPKEVEIEVPEIISVPNSRLNSFKYELVCSIRVLQNGQPTLTFKSKDTYYTLTSRSEIRSITPTEKESVALSTYFFFRKVTESHSRDILEEMNVSSEGMDINS